MPYPSYDNASSPAATAAPAPSSAALVAQDLPQQPRLLRHPRSLLTYEQMSIAIQRECARADRKNKSLVLALFELPNKNPYSPSSRRLVRTLIRRMRVTDDVGWYDKRHVGVLLTDTTAAGAWNFVKDVTEKLAARGMSLKHRMYAYPEPPKGEPVIVPTGQPDNSRPLAPLTDNQPSSPIRAAAG